MLPQKPSPLSRWSATDLSKITNTPSLCLGTGPEELTYKITESLNKHDYTNKIFQHIAPRIRSDTDVVHGRSRADFIDAHRKLSEAYPKLWVNIVNCSTEVDLEQGRATVFMLSEITGHVANVRRETVHVCYWRLIRGEWVYYQYRGLRGLGPC